MDIKSCRNCGKIFQFRGSYICPDCVREIDDLFVAVRSYMYANPNASIEAICEETGASSDMIMDWLREGRLITVEGAAPLLACTKCGKPIPSGRMCASCSNDLASTFETAAKSLTDELQRQSRSSSRLGVEVDGINSK